MASVKPPGKQTPLECIRLGDQCMQQKDHRGALGYYTAALDLIAASPGTMPGQRNRPAPPLDLRIRACFGKGEALRMLRDFDQALVAYETALDAYRSAGGNQGAVAVRDIYYAYLGKSQALRGKKNFPQALDSCERAIELQATWPAAYHEKALAHYNLRAYQESLQACEDALSRDPQYIPAHIGKGDACLALKNFPQALQTFERASQLNPASNTYAYSGQGQALYHLQRYDEAQRACEQAIQISAENFLAYLCIGDIFRTLGRHQDACERYTRALQKNDRSVLAYIGRGACLLATGEKTQALADYEQALHLDADTVEAACAQAYLGQGAALQALERYPQARTAYQKALQIIARCDYSKDEQLAAMLGEALALFTLQDYPALQQTCEQILVLDPHQADAFYYQGEAYRHSNRHAEAIQAYNQALEYDDTRLTIYEGMEQSLCRLKSYRELASVYERVYQELNRRQSKPSYLSAFGEFLLALERYQEALDAYEEALRLAPDDKALFMGKGNALFHLARYGPAGAAYTEALRLDRNLIAAYIGKGDAFRLQQSYPDATSAYFQAIDTARSLGRLAEAAPAFSGRGLVKRKLGNTAGALKDFQEAVRHRANQASYHFQLGFTLTALARYGEALQAYEQAIRLGSSNARELARFHTQKGHVYRRIKRGGEAQTAYEQALQIVPDFEDAIRGMRLLP
ncbi:MAG TPA: tetratricopeptide repeat protein [Ktedonobacteraceae bacterium]|jgi:tetratricopeptide (TPR) repeat protein